MKAILSCTADDLYLFNLPFAIYSWHRLGVECVIFVPREDIATDKFGLVMEYSGVNSCHWNTFSAPKEKEGTYAQCARLFGAATVLVSPSDVLITADADMCVFNKEYWGQFEYNGAINIIGADLVPQGQYPMCYIAMPAVGWRHVMDIGARSSYQEMLDDLLGGIEAENFRGNYWAKDQETAYNRIHSGPFPIVEHNRAKPGTQFATRRADRDGWPEHHDLNIIDAHLPRPGYTDDNYGKIFWLFEEMYPAEDHMWMDRYRDEYLKLMEL